MDRSGDLYESSMGQLGSDIRGGSVQLGKNGRPDHITVFGQPVGPTDGPRISWDVPGGNPHLIDQGYPKGNPGRYPFGK
jgi:hypothetical protein